MLSYAFDIPWFLQDLNFSDGQLWTAPFHHDLVHFWTLNLLFWSFHHLLSYTLCFLTHSCLCLDFFLPLMPSPTTRLKFRSTEMTIAKGAQTRAHCRPIGQYLLDNVNYQCLWNIRRFSPQLSRILRNDSCCRFGSIPHSLHHSCLHMARAYPEYPAIANYLCENFPYSISCSHWTHNAGFSIRLLLW